MHLLKQNRRSILNARSLFRTKHVFLLAFFSFYFYGFAQTIPDSFRKTTDSLIKVAPKTYSEINAILYNARKDTSYLRYFANTARQENYLDGQAYALNQLGRSYRNISQYSKALALHQKALNVAKTAANIEFEIFGLNMISVIFRKTDAIQSALDYSQRALELAEKIKTPSNGIKRSINVSLNNIGNIYQTLEQYDQAIEKYMTAVILDTELENNLGLAINYQNIGECYEALGQLDKALANFNISLNYNVKIDSDKGRIICTYSIAHVFTHEGKTIEAENMLKSVLAPAYKLDDKEIITSVLINLGWTLIKLKRLTEAEKHLTKARKMAHTFQMPSQIAESNKFLSELSVEQGNYKSALEYYKERKKFEEKTSNGRNLRYVNDIIMRYESDKRRSQLVELSEENELITLKLRRNRTTLLVSSLGLLLLGGILYVLYRQYQLKNDSKLLTLEQSMLRSQMNPHFLFNSLNSIKLYIINNEKKNAVHYLNKFSKLVRKILEASPLKEISLDEELETVELYMNIENIRFSNEINFEVNVDDNIDPHTIKIPSLILQPFLENAIWHGLSSKKNDKNLVLHISRENETFIKISITDNGIGRKAAEKIKERKILKRKSVGISITKERLANFSKDNLNSFNMEITDLYDENNKAAGTRITLHIPTV